MSEKTDPVKTHTIQYAMAIREFGKHLPRTVANVEDLKSLIQSSGRIGAAYIAAKGARDTRGYQLGLINCITEVRTTHYWLELVDTQGSPELNARREQLMKASNDLAGLFENVIQHANQTR